MKINGGLIALSIVGLIVLFAIVFGIGFVSLSNKEIRIRQQITMKIEDNKSEYDNMWKKIKQTAEVTEKDRQSLMEIFVSHADARTSKGDDGSLMKWVQESVPNIDSGTYKNLINLISSSRDSWTMRQKELLQMKLQHDTMLLTFPGSILLGSRESIDVIIITSTKTEEVFEDGKDNDISVF